MSTTVSFPLPAVTFLPPEDKMFVTRIRFTTKPNIKQLRVDLAEFYSRLGYQVEITSRRTKDYIFAFSLDQRRNKYLQFVIFFVAVSDLEYDIESVTLH